MGRFCEARRGQLNQTFRSLIIQSQNRLHVVELGHGVCSAGPSGRHGRDLAENRKSLSQKQAPISTLAVGKLIISIPPIHVLFGRGGAPPGGGSEGWRSAWISTNCTHSSKSSG